MYRGAAQRIPNLILANIAIFKNEVKECDVVFWFDGKFLTVTSNFELIHKVVRKSEVTKKKTKESDKKCNS